MGETIIGFVCKSFTSRGREMMGRMNQAERKLMTRKREKMSREP